MRGLQVSFQKLDEKINITKYPAGIRSFFSLAHPREQLASLNVDFLSFTVKSLVGDFQPLLNDLTSIWMWRPIEYMATLIFDVCLFCMAVLKTAEAFPKVLRRNLRFFLKPLWISLDSSMTFLPQPLTSD